MRRKSLQHHTDGLMGLLLFGVFAVCVLSVLLTGAGAYRRLTERDRAAYDRRTAAQYIATRIRQSDTLGGIDVTAFGDADALLLREGEGPFVTWVYCHDGYLMELYCAEDAGLEPQDGERVLAADSLTAVIEDGLLTATIYGREGVDTIRLSLRSGEGAAS